MAISQSNVFSVSVVGASGLPTYAANTTVGNWLSIPNTRFELSTQNPPLPFPYALSGPRRIIDAWGGIAYRKNGSKIIAWGGGHNDYSGNDMYEFSAGDDSPSWSLIKPYTPESQIVQSVRRYNDGNPVSIHSYYCLHFIDQMDELVVLGLEAVYFSGNSPFSVAERFDYPTKTWRSVGLCPTVPFCSAAGTGKAKHPVTEEIWYVDVFGGEHLRKYNPLTQVATDVGATSLPGGNSIYRALCIDPVRNKLVMSKFYGNQGQWISLDMTTRVPAVMNLTGDAITAAQSGSLEYDSIGDRYLYIDPSMNVYAINPSTNAVTRLVLGGDTPPATLVGFHSRTKFCAELKGLISVPAATSNVFYARLYS